MGHTTLSDLLGPGRCVVAPDAHDLMTAQVVEETGFQAVFVGSFGSAASRWGLPDQSLVDLGKLVEHFAAVGSRVGIPMIVDLEDGGPNAVTAFHATRAAERAGVSAIQIEDQLPGKLLGTPGRLYPLDVAVGKIEAAAAARTSPDVLIIGRTEALSVGLSPQDAIERCTAYVAAGADLVTCSWLPNEDSAEFAERCGAPVAAFVVGTHTAAELAGHGISLAIYPMQTTLIAFEAVSRALQALHETGAALDADELLPLMNQITELTGGADNAQLAATYGASAHDPVQ